MHSILHTHVYDERTVSTSESAAAAAAAAVVALRNRIAVRCCQ
jgi:hypothetical protein